MLKIKRKWDSVSRFTVVEVGNKVVDEGEKRGEYVLEDRKQCKVCNLFLNQGLIIKVWNLPARL